MTKSINIPEVVGYLNRAFSLALDKAQDTGNLGKQAVRKVDETTGNIITTPLYDYQVEFAYLIDNIQRSPAYIVPRYISEANSLLETVKELSEQ